MRATPEGGVSSLEAMDISHLENLFGSEDISLVPLFGVSEERLLHEAETRANVADEATPDLSTYYLVNAPDDQLEMLAGKLLKEDTVEAAYIKPPAEPAAATEEQDESINEMLPADGEAPPVTADFTTRQIYLNAAPSGIDARYSWSLAGGRGTGVRVIDIEGAWRFTHEDLTQNQGGVVGTQSTSLGWRNHGTAVVGEIGGDINAFGITG